MEDVGLEAIEKPGCGKCEYICKDRGKCLMSATPELIPVFINTQAMNCQVQHVREITFLTF